MALYPDVNVELVGEDGNAFSILGRVKKALEKSGHPEAVAPFLEEAQSGDYGNLLRTVIKYVKIDDDDDYDGWDDDGDYEW